MRSHCIFIETVGPDTIYYVLNGDGVTCWYGGVYGRFYSMDKAVEYADRWVDTYYVASTHKQPA